ncbi:MAG: hypothetical protein K5798_08535 [Nitrosopumilus sp.]|uniref:hypothetical protein n=1 Tax=Nitrosopumilus sp. TaxID=2024843 RepID=UPI002431F81D|nr:hypothetical protein [Nitrosopumilus sp.]MCV0367289.1 hypothetical protein [Nitrosopumilus sp.]
MTEGLKTTLRYYGISPWEIEVLYGFLNSHFTVIQDEIEQDDSDFVSSLDVEIPLAFNEEFFQWFDFKRWEKVKAVFKEMKRRRGTNNALKVKINFSGNPKIVFSVDVEDKQWFDNAIEKIDFVLELVPHHLDPQKLPSDISEINYKFDSDSIRWRLNSASSKSKKYSFTGNSWKEIT